MALTQKLIDSYRQLIQGYLGGIEGYTQNNLIPGTKGLGGTVDEQIAALHFLLNRKSGSVVAQSLQEHISRIQEIIDCPGDYVEQEENYTEFQIIIYEEIGRHLQFLQSLTPEQQTAYTQQSIPKSLPAFSREATLRTDLFNKNRIRYLKDYGHITQKQLEKLSTPVLKLLSTADGTSTFIAFPRPISADQLALVTPKQFEAIIACAILDFDKAHTLSNLQCDGILEGISYRNVCHPLFSEEIYYSVFHYDDRERADSLCTTYILNEAKTRCQKLQTLAEEQYLDACNVDLDTIHPVWHLALSQLEAHHMAGMLLGLSYDAVLKLTPEKVLLARAYTILTDQPLDETLQAMANYSVSAIFQSYFQIDYTPFQQRNPDKDRFSPVLLQQLYFQKSPVLMKQLEARDASWQERVSDKTGRSRSLSL